MMRRTTAINILTRIQAEDNEFQDGKAGTFCSECKANTAVGFYPFWHFFRRSLCSSCAQEYIKTLKALGAGGITD